MIKSPIAQCAALALMAALSLTACGSTVQYAGTGTPLAGSDGLGTTVPSTTGEEGSAVGGSTGAK